MSKQLNLLKDKYPSLAIRALIFLATSLGSIESSSALAQSKLHSEVPQIKIGNILWDRHEMTIGEVKRYAKATQFISDAERAGFSLTYDMGWAKKSGWNWRRPYGVDANDKEPAVHLNFDEARQICQAFGKRLPRDQEWTDAAYLEQRESPAQGFEKGKRYPYPNGTSAKASHCLNDCANLKGVAPPSILDRGTGHVFVQTTPAGVNGLFDMGGNVWEWVDDPQQSNEKITRGSSWWYGASRQLEKDVATKPRETSVVYIGFRCVQDR